MTAPPTAPPTARPLHPFIETFTGARFQPIAPIVEDIAIEDIAHALANQCRFSGHTRVFYSVAEHSLRVAMLVAEWGEDVDVQTWALLHDASEAYLVDLPTPLKTHPTIGEGYQRAERVLMRAVCERFHLDPKMPEPVRIADAILLATEVRDLMPAKPEHWSALAFRPHDIRIAPWAPHVAERNFLRWFRGLESRRA